MKNAKSRTETKRREKTFIHLLSLTSNAQPSPWSPARGFHKFPPPSPPSFSSLLSSSPGRTSLPAWFMEGSVRVGLVPPLSHPCSCRRCSLRVNQLAVLHRFLSFVFGVFPPPAPCALSSHSFSPFLLFCSSQLSALSSHHSDTQHSAPSPRLSRTRAFVSLRRPTDVRQGNPLATRRTRAFFCSTAPSSASGSTGL